MKAFFSPSFATKLSIYVLSFTLIVFVCIMMLFYNYSRKQITEDAIDHAHGLLRNTATQISGELQIVESTLEQSVWIVEKNLSTPDSLKDVLTAIVKNNSLIVGSGIAFIPGYYKEKGKYFMPYAFSINEGAEEIVNYRYHQRKMLEEVLRLQVDQQSGQRTYRLSREGFARAAMILTPAGSASIRYEDFVK